MWKIMDKGKPTRFLLYVCKVKKFQFPKKNFFWTAFKQSLFQQPCRKHTQRHRKRFKFRWLPYHVIKTMKCIWLFSLMYNQQWKKKKKKKKKIKSCIWRTDNQVCAHVCVWGLHYLNTCYTWTISSIVWVFICDVL